LWLHKKVWQLIFFHLSLLLLFLDPGSEIRDPGSGMGKNQDPGCGIRDKHPGSATLPPTLNFGLAYNFFLFTAHSVSGKKPKTFAVMGQMIKKNGFFGSVTNSPTVGFLSGIFSPNRDDF
jgi:hypothetical protein